MRSIPMEENLNPYAAPKTESPAPKIGASGRRPPVVKWAAFVLGVGTCAASLVYWETISAYGAWDVWKHQPLFDLPLFLPVAFFLCLFRRRSKITFFIIAFVLGWMLWRAATKAFAIWSLPHASMAYPAGEREAELLLALGLAYLFYRFTFGLPSRAYHGMVRQDGIEQRQREE